LGLAFLTDVADGYLARRLNRVSAFGSKFDSLVDGILAPSAIVWVLLLHPEVLTDHLVLAGLWVGTTYTSLTIGLVRHRRFANLHLQSSRIACVAQYAFLVDVFVASPYDPLLLYLAAALGIYSSLETLILQLALDEVSDRERSLSRALTGRILEPELEHDHGFLNTYQQSKYEAELLLARYRDVVPIVVFRPSIVLDGPGSLQRRSAFLFAFELIRRGLMPAVPGSADKPVDLVTEGDVARAIARLLFMSCADGVYHVAGGDRAPKLDDIVAPYGIRYLGEEQFAWEISKWRYERPRLAQVYDELASFIFELAYPKIFDTSRSESALGETVRLEDPLAALLDDDSGLLAQAEGGASVR
jgi:CDP-alcohol phosphatidyltransferase/Male sterility protein